MFESENSLYPYSVTDLSKKDALILAPHPDDESLGCGGSIVKHIKAGSRVKVIFLTNGEGGDFKGRFGKNYVEIRRKSAQKAMETIGVKDFEFWGYGDRNLHLVGKELEERLLYTIETFSPSLIYVPSPYEAHPDHRASFRLIWGLRKNLGITLALYEVLMPLYPNTLVDITNEMKKKKKAIKSYFTELYYNDYLKKVEGLNRFRTATLPKDVKYAEAFLLLENGVQIADTFPKRLFIAALQHIL